MSEQNKELVRRFFEIGDRESRTPVELLAPEFTAHMPGLPPMDVDTFEQFEAAFIEAFSDVHRGIDELVAENDKVAARMTMRFTHTGDFQGLAPTGETATVTGIAIVRVADGRLVEFWGSPDNLGFMQQLGAIPAPA